MVGRLSTYAKNRILNLRFQQNYKIKHIALTLMQEDNIKVSRESISTFLKKYIDTKSINDKPRSGRNKKLTPEEINLIGEVTRLNRDITAPKIKQYLNLNVSTHTILRASKLFEWNKNNPNSNEAKKAAALERQLNGETKRRSKAYRNVKTKSDQQQSEMSSQDDTSMSPSSPSTNHTKPNEKLDMNLISEKEILMLKNVSSSPMVFATKILMKIFRPCELQGHNVSGKTFSKNVKNKKALDERRINYIRWLVDNNFESSNREQLWKMCRTAINKIILINEKKAAKRMDQHENEDEAAVGANLSFNHQELLDGLIHLTSQNEAVNRHQEQVKTTIVKLNDATDDFVDDDEEESNQNENEDEEEEEEEEEEESHHQQLRSTRRTNKKSRRNYSKSKISSSTRRAKGKSNKLTSDDDENDATATVNENDDEDNTNNNENDDEYASIKHDPSYNLNLLTEKEILLIKNLYCSPMIFSTKVLTKIFTTDELYGHNLTSKTFHKTSLVKPALDSKRLNYIKWLIEKYFDNGKSVTHRIQLWKSCRKAMCRVLRNIDKKVNEERSQAVANETMDGDDECQDDTSAMYQSSSKTTVVVLCDDPDQERQMLMEEEMNANQHDDADVKAEETNNQHEQFASL